MIQPTIDLVEKFEETDEKPVKYDHKSDLVSTTLTAKTEAEIEAYSNVSA